MILVLSAALDVGNPRRINTISTYEAALGPPFLAWSSCWASAGSDLFPKRLYRGCERTTSNPEDAQGRLFDPLAALAGTLAQAASTFKPARPPAVPLAVKSPYLNTWLQGDSGGILPGSWPQFWT